VKKVVKTQYVENILVTRQMAKKTALASIYDMYITLQPFTKIVHLGAKKFNSERKKINVE
jgi:hypothetical protein